VVLVLFGVDAGGFRPHLGVGVPVAVVALVPLLFHVVEADHGGVVAVEEFGDIVPLAEVVAFRRVGNVVVVLVVVCLLYTSPSPPRR
ncbi:hypothetical protein DCD75_18450, partial [Acinetobacter baumannii]